MCSRRPQRRIDENFFSNQLIKVRNIVDLFIEKKVDFCIHGGDMYDIPDLPDFLLLNNVIPEFKRLKSAGIDFYINLGSHDLFGYNMESVYTTAVGSLIRYGLLKLPAETETIKGIKFKFINAKTKHTLDLYRDLGDAHIVVSHNMLVPQSVPYDHILFSDLNFCKQVFLCGHYHKQFAVRDGSNIFLNPGPVIRTSIVEAEHKPSAMVITVPDNIVVPIKVNNYYLKHERNVFDLNSVVADKEKEEKVTLTVKNTKFESYDLIELADKLGAENNTSADVMVEVKRRLNDAKIGLHA